MSTASINQYDASLSPARDAFTTSKIVTTVLNPSIDPKLLHMYLLNFAAIGVSLTQSVVTWMKQTANRCAAIGLKDIADEVYDHIKEEEGHHLLHLNDLKIHVRNWNAKYGDTLNSDDLLNRPQSLAAKQYTDLHNRVINGDTPYCQFAIELEIGWISCRFGEPFINHCVQRIGPEILQGLSFVTLHSKVDPYHTEENRVLIDKVLQRRPESLSSFIEAGTESLLIFQTYSNECLVLSESVMT